MPFPTLTTLPTFPLDPDGMNEDAVLRSSFEGGYELTRPKFTRARRNWGVSYPAINSTDKAALVTFETTTTKNGADSFTWTHPVSGTVYTVRFTTPLRFVYIAPGMWRAEFGLREV